MSQVYNRVNKTAVEMNYQWNTRKFKDISKKRFCDALNSIGKSDRVLVIEPNLLPSINGLVSLSELTESTPVRKILLLDDQLTSELTELLGTLSNMKLIFLIDIKIDLVVPKLLRVVIENLELNEVDIMYCTWPTELTVRMKQVPHLIQSQLQESCQTVNVIPWEQIPIPQIDDNFICPHILYNSEGDSLYSPFENSLKQGTREVLLDSMVNCVQSLLKETNSTITNAVTMGNYSQEFAELLKSRINADMTRQDDVIFQSLHGKKATVDIETDMIVIERELDPITPLLTELTYFGVLNDFYGFDNNGRITGKDGNVYNFVSEDEIWNELKFHNFGAIGPFLNQLAKDLQAKYDSRHDAETVGQIKKFVDSLGSLQQEQKMLKMHTTLSSDILEEIEKNDTLEFNNILELEQDILLDNLGTSIAIDRILTLLYEGAVKQETIIRLVCLLSLCKNGLRENEFDELKKEMIDTYGVEIMFKLEWCTRNGVFSSKTLLHSELQHGVISMNKEYRYISQWLNTLPSDEQDDSQSRTQQQGDDSTIESRLKDPREPIFAYCGVTPLSIRLIQALYDRTTLTKHYSSQQPFMISREPNATMLDPLLHQIYGGDDSIITQSRWIPEPTARLKRVRAASTQQNKKQTGQRDTVLLVFLGGVTPGEVALVKFLQKKLQQRNVNKRFIIIADDIVKRSSQ